MRQDAISIESDPRWHAVMARDATSDGRFYYSVASTGIYCRPSCAAKRPRAENVRFHATCAEAEQAGFRPCKRCKPDQESQIERHAAAVTQACRTIEAADEPPTLEALAAAAGLSPFHFHRLFKSVTGITPRAYAQAHRVRLVREKLECREGSVTEAIYGAGFNSSGRFYELSSQVLGMTPRDYRAGGANTHIRFAIGQCSLGAVLVAASDQGICAISLGEDADALVREFQDRFPQARLTGDDADFDALVAKAVAAMDRPGLGDDLPLDIRGTAFQQRVWQALREIPAGTTVTYTELANRLGAPRAVRAVASACASNNVAVVIPCHRVVRIGGELAGYRWGIERKRALLEREGEG